MRYIDSGARVADQTLGDWLLNQLTADVDELRVQTGFFTADALGFFAPTLIRLRADDKPTCIVVGSNEPGTLGADVHELADLIGLPRTNGQLGVVSYDRGYYHPKVYHLRRTDGSQCAYVGSANFTAPGATGLHVEAGILLDSRDDDPTILDQIAGAVDAWFAGPARPGFELVTDHPDVDRLVTEGVLLASRPPRTPRARRAAGGTTMPPRARLERLVPIPPLPTPPAAPTAPVAAPVVLPQFAPLQQFYPAPFDVDWTIVGPTHAAAALSGTALPGGAVGLVVQLPMPVIKGILGQEGTPSLTIPVGTLNTIRFAVALGRSRWRPRAVFNLHVRYLGGPLPIVGPMVASNVIPYGYLPGEKPHKEVRLGIRKRSFGIVPLIHRAHLPLPAEDDFALLEWPTPARPDFRLTFLEPNSALFHQAQTLFNAARASGQLVGGGASWLPPGVSPPAPW